MLQLMLMRHGQAESVFDAETDHSRALSEYGKTQTQHQAHLFPTKTGDRLFVSDAKRTVQTATILTSTWALATRSPSPLMDSSSAAYLAESTTLMDLIRMTQSDVQRLWLVGHNPGIGDLISVLTGEYVRMATADIAQIQLTLQHWEDLDSGQGRLTGHHQSLRP